MFTGVIRHFGEILAAEPQSSGVRLTVRPKPELSSVRAGDSVALDGVCLTVVDPAPDGLLFDVVQQTLDLTSLSERKVGDRVHLEPAMRVGDAVDGHHVQGHVEACGTVLHNGEDASRGWRLRVEVPQSLMACVVPQGSITLHGVSLTVAHRDEASVEVALIPETLERTNLGHLQVGDPIHIETDVLCRTVVQTVRSLGLGPESSS